MSHLDVDVSNAQAPEPVAAGTEHELRILDTRQGEDKNGAPYAMPRFEILDDEMAPDFTDFIAIPTDEMKSSDPKRFNRAAFKMQQFCLAFGIDPSSPGDPEVDWKGLTGWAILGVKTDEQYGDQNTVRKYITGA